MADTQQDIDFTIMYATHHAFRRDLRRLAAAVQAGQTGAPHVLAGWKNFGRQLDNHHSVEDAALWPQVEAKIQQRPDDLKLMQAMEAEHTELGPRIGAVDTALTSRAAGLGAAVQDLYEVMDEHFTHEEDSALPLIQDVLTRAEWRKFGLANARNLGPRGIAVYVPWVIDGATAEERQDFLGAFPPPVRGAYSLLWRRSYAKKSFWRV